MDKYYIKEEVWPKFCEFFQSPEGIYTRNEQNLRRFLEGVFWITRTGAPWRTLPSQYGNWSLVHKRFVPWAEKGVWEPFLVHVSKNYDGESVMLDRTIIRAHACASGYVKGGNTEQSLGRRRMALQPKYTLSSMLWGMH